MDRSWRARHDPARLHATVAGKGEASLELPYKVARAYLLEEFEREYLTALLARHGGRREARRSTGSTCYGCWTSTACGNGRRTATHGPQTGAIPGASARAGRYKRPSTGGAVTQTTQPTPPDRR